MKEIILDIDGMRCSACASNVENKLKKVEGVSDVSVNLLTNSATIYYENEVDELELVSTVNGLGFVAKVNKGKLEFKEDKFFNKVELIILIILGSMLMYVGMSHMFPFQALPSFIDMNKSPIGFAIAQMILVIPIMVIGFRFFISGVRAIIKLAPNMDSLVTIGTFSAFIYSFVNSIFVFLGHVEYAHNLYFESAGVVIVLIYVGKFLEQRSKNKAKRSINELAKLIPTNANILVDGKEENICVSAIKQGDMVVVKAGEKIAVDGIIVSGSSSVNQAALTGESLPLFLKEGDKVLGGSICLDGSLVIKADKINDETTLNNILKLVTKAQGEKAPISRIADKISLYFVPTVIAIAVISLIVWSIIGKAFSFNINIFVAVLVVACPCALGLATPIATVMASYMGVKHGVLFKSGASLETLNKITTIALDKTGTITNGKLSVEEINTTLDLQEFLKIAYSIEKQSNHPIAQAITEYAKNKGVDTLYNIEVMNEIGKGIKGNEGKDTYLLGRKTFLLENDIKVDVDDAEGFSEVYIAKNKKYIGRILLKDTIKESAKEMIELFSKQGIKTVMLTGDNESTARQVAEKLGIDKYYANVLPNQKNEIITNLQEQGEIVAFVGDGINDAPALTKSDVGISVYGGTDIADESSNILLMNEDLISIYDAYSLSKKTLNIIKTNLFWAFIYNTLGIFIAAGVLYPLGILLSPLVSSIAMGFSSICVVLNSLRIRLFKGIKEKKKKVKNV